MMEMYDISDLGHAPQRDRNIIEEFRDSVMDLMGSINTPEPLEPVAPNLSSLAGGAAMNSPQLHSMQTPPANFDPTMVPPQMMAPMQQPPAMAPMDAQNSMQNQDLMTQSPNPMM